MPKPDERNLLLNLPGAAVLLLGETFGKGLDRCEKLPAFLSRTLPLPGLTLPLPGLTLPFLGRLFPLLGRLSPFLGRLFPLLGELPFGGLSGSSFSSSSRSSRVLRHHRQ